MEDLLAKISSYNFFNFLFPGVIFAVIAERVTSYTFLHNNLGLHRNNLASKSVISR